MNNEDSVLKRNGKKEVMSFSKILKRVKILGNNTLNINYIQNYGRFFIISIINKFFNFFI